MHFHTHQIDGQGGASISITPNFSALITSSDHDLNHQVMWVILHINDMYFGILNVYTPNDASQRIVLWQWLGDNLPFT